MLLIHTMITPQHFNSFPHDVKLKSQPLLISHVCYNMNECELNI